MVEMLGVLAIIGVLSVGGLAGYSKAMEKYKLNKFSESINQLLAYAIQNIQTFGEVSDHIETSTIYYTDIFKKLNMLPEGIRYRDSSYLEDVFSNPIWVFTIKQSGSSSHGMGYTLQSKGLNEKICFNLLQIAKEHAQELRFVQTDKLNSAEDAYSFISRINGNKLCTKNTDCLSHLTLESIKKICHNCEDSKACRFYFYW